MNTTANNNNSSGGDHHDGDGDDDPTYGKPTDSSNLKYLYFFFLIIGVIVIGLIIRIIVKKRRRLNKLEKNEVLRSQVLRRDMQEYPLQQPSIEGYRNFQISRINRSENGDEDQGPAPPPPSYHQLPEQAYFRDSLPPPEYEEESHRR